MGLPSRCFCNYKKGNNKWFGCLSMEFKGPYGGAAVAACSIVCTGENIANCSKSPQFLRVICALCPRCARCARTPRGYTHCVRHCKCTEVEPLWCIVGCTACCAAACTVRSSSALPGARKGVRTCTQRRAMSGAQRCGFRCALRCTRHGPAAQRPPPPREQPASCGYLQSFA